MEVEVSKVFIIFAPVLAIIALAFAAGMAARVK